MKGRMEYAENLGVFLPEEPFYPGEMSLAKSYKIHCRNGSYCRSGSRCRYLHAPGRQNSGSSSSATAQREMRDEERLASGSVAMVEMEIQELLRERRGPVYLSTLPQLYQEMFGKTLQGEGYFTETQRLSRNGGYNGRGYSLTDLLSRLKNTVTLKCSNDHLLSNGQQEVVPVEDAHKFTAFSRELNDFSEVNCPSSRKIFLTFPSESSVTEEDLWAYFSEYGLVHRVKIPSQRQQNFGFVTFVYSETVKIVLSKGCPHYICNERVFAKPYKKKASKVKESDGTTERWSDTGHRNPVPAQQQCYEVAKVYN